MPILTVSIAFDRSERAWVVRRAHTVMGTFPSRDEALRGACEMGVNLRRRMHCDMRFRVRDGLGKWHVYATMNDDRSADDVASRLVHTCRTRMPNPLTVFLRQSPVVLYSMAKAALEKGKSMLARPRISIATRH